MTALLEYIDILYPIKACNRKYTLSWLNLALCKGKVLCERKVAVVRMENHNMSVPIHFTHIITCCIVAYLPSCICIVA